MTVSEKLGAVLSTTSFYEKYKDVNDSAALVAAVKAEVPEATEEEIDAYLTELSATIRQTQEGEMSETDLDTVAGGIVITAGVIGAVCACVGTSATVGGLIGAAVWYYKNRK